MRATLWQRAAHRFPALGGSHTSTPHTLSVKADGQNVQTHAEPPPHSFTKRLRARTETCAPLKPIDCEGDEDFCASLDAQK
jgi:hypothetical protein